MLTNHKMKPNILKTGLFHHMSLAHLISITSKCFPSSHPLLTQAKLHFLYQTYQASSCLHVISYVTNILPSSIAPLSLSLLIFLNTQLKFHVLRKKPFPFPDRNLLFFYHSLELISLEFCFLYYHAIVCLHIYVLH